MKVFVAPCTSWSASRGVQGCQAETGLLDGKKHFWGKTKFFVKTVLDNLDGTT
jgi:hypothetical protein